MAERRAPPRATQGEREARTHADDAHSDSAVGVPSGHAAVTAVRKREVWGTARIDAPG